MIKIFSVLAQKGAYMGNYELRKDDPVYYKVAINKLIKQAKENGLEVDYEMLGNNGKITSVAIAFRNDIGEMACFLPNVTSL